MGRFIVSRNASGVRFLLESDKGRTLAVSKEYATLDAAKKGICSLVYYAPIVPLVDATAGEHAPNPKIEMFQENDAFAYAVKSANGKSVITATGFATRKACLRAVAMLRTGVLGAEVVFANPAGLIPLTVGGMVRDPAPRKPQEAPLVEAAILSPIDEEMWDEPAPDLAYDTVFAEERDIAEEIASIPTEVSPAPHSDTAPPVVPVQATAKPQPIAPRVPRRVTLKGEGALTRQPTENKEAHTSAAAEGKTQKKGLLSRFLKRSL